ncbi:MAG: hypothetical protein JJ926_13940 [Roseitalea sp.]|uniref:Lipoprotein n=1 Tax=Oceaniradius stylonematis TaxID=2184161 RepID=A0A3A8A9G9_9HYPH|nr:hypothetical protein [Oceaniradius stylonematis]MBO6554110.1 hypothetical protein [Roseitalea sp.]MBO6953154.1 hypothetical protein [Rhizobiaceae bacterium]RNC91508.1 MAG: hypothetical protein ED558_14360 [Oricola sp.]MBO6593501.1 hypothetical protein [Roseitalea sp.]MBO6600897.1 hypothetical protein [Roseitalea sp.]
MGIGTCRAGLDGKSAVRTIRSLAAIGMLAALAACQSGGPSEVLDVSSNDEAFTEADLRAYCPRVTLLEGTAYLRTYTDGNEGNPDEVVHQAVISDVTRTCRYRNGQLFMTVAAAGRVVNGPKGAPGSLNLPVRVAIRAGENLPYSQLGRIDVAMGGGATQFIFRDDQIVLPEPETRNLQVIVGFDEGPYDTP